MGWRFKKRVKILPGISLNFGKRGYTSTTVGGKWFKTNFSKKGSRNTFSTPGPGFLIRVNSINRSNLRRDTSINPKVPSGFDVEVDRWRKDLESRTSWT